MAHFFNDNNRGFLIQDLVDGHHHAHVHERLDDFTGFHCHLVCKIRNRDGFGYQNFMHDRLSRCRKSMLLIFGILVRLRLALVRSPTLANTDIITSLDGTPFIIGVRPFLGASLAFFAGAIFILLTILGRRFMQRPFG